MFLALLPRVKNPTYPANIAPVCDWNQGSATRFRFCFIYINRTRAHAEATCVFTCLVRAHRKTLNAGLTNQRSPRRNLRPFSGSPRQRETGAFGPHAVKRSFSMSRSYAVATRGGGVSSTNMMLFYYHFPHTYWLVYLVLETNDQLSIIREKVWINIFLLLFLYFLFVLVAFYFLWHFDP